MTHSFIDSSILTTTKRHVGNRALGAVTRLGIGGDILNASNNASVGTRTTAVKHLHGVELSLLRSTIGNPSDGTGDVSAMAVAIRVISVASEVFKPLGTFKSISPGLCLRKEVNIRPSNSGWVTKIPVSMTYAQVPSPELLS